MRGGKDAKTSDVYTFGIFAVIVAVTLHHT